MFYNELNRGDMIAFLGGSHVGVLGLLLSKALDNVLCCVAYSEDVKKLAKSLNIRTYNSIKDPRFINQLGGVNLVLSVHGREIIPEDILKFRRCINVHPFFNYKGINPVGRALEANDHNGSVVAHLMTSRIDIGSVVAQETIKTKGISVQEIYNELYLLYINVITKTINMELK